MRRPLSKEDDEEAGHAVQLSSWTAFGLACIMTGATQSILVGIVTFVVAAPAILLLTALCSAVRKLVRGER